MSRERLIVYTVWATTARKSYNEGRLFSIHRSEQGALSEIMRRPVFRHNPDRMRLERIHPAVVGSPTIIADDEVHVDGELAATLTRWVVVPMRVQR